MLYERSSLINLCYAIIQREWLLAGRQISSWINPLLFFILIVILFPLAISPETALLQKMAPGVIWTAALLANLLGLDRMFRIDYEEGVLEQYLLSPYPVSLILSIKIFFHWALMNVPLILLVPLFSLLFHISLREVMVLSISLLLGSPIFSLLGAVTLAMTVKLQNNSVLLALCVFPLIIPILIFGAGSAVSVSIGNPATAQLAFLGAILLLSATFIPLVIGNALRIGVS